MHRPLSIAEHGMVCVLMVVALAIVLACTGCATIPANEERYHIKAFDVIVTTPARVDAMWKDAYPHLDQRTTAGFCDMQKRLIVVPHSVKGEGLAVDWIVGHEVQHLPEWGGIWHDENGKVIPRSERP